VTINREAHRTANIVRNLLTFARKQPQEKQPMDINESIQRVLELRAYEQKVNNIQVNTHFAPDFPQVMGNNSQLQQVFFNIVINAEFFMLEAHARGTLTVTTERIGDSVRASFADDGPGISEENMRHLFNPFFTTKEVGKGTGLGLSICHGIIAEHGGRIWAESESGKGANFIIELPVYKGSASEKAEANPDSGR
jgi:signal transduction histidine kinase